MVQLCNKYNLAADGRYTHSFAVRLRAALH
jgi:hypothetical protein